MATPAVAARALMSSSSSALNCPRMLSARYRLPNTSSRTRIGRRGSWSSAGGRAGTRGAGVVGDAVQPDRLRVVDQRAEQALALGEVPDPRATASGSSRRGRTRRARLRGRCTPSAAYRAPTSSRAASTMRRSTTGRASSLVTLVGAQQPAQPALGRHHLLGALHQLCRAAGRAPGGAGRGTSARPRPRSCPTSPGYPTGGRAGRCCRAPVSSGDGAGGRPRPAAAVGQPSGKPSGFRVSAVVKHRALWASPA